MIPITTDGISFPKSKDQIETMGESKSGYQNAIFLLSPKKENTYESLSSPFIDFRMGLYKYYLIDFIYKEKIGFKKYVANNTTIFQKEFHQRAFNGSLRIVTNTNKMDVLKRKLNLLVDLGEWNSIYFKFQVRSSLEKICSDYINYLAKRINDSDYEDYRKILYVDLGQWFDVRSKISLNRKNLTNPVSILLVTLYKHPELLVKLQGIDFLFANAITRKAMKVSASDITKKNYMRIKQKILSMISEECQDVENLNESSTLNETPSNKPLLEMTPEELSSKLNESPQKKKEEKIRKKLLGELTKNLLGDEVEDITEEFEDDEESAEDIQVDDDKINEIKNIANDYMDQHPELLQDENTTVSLKEITDVVKQRYYIHEYAPQYTDKQLKKIQELTDIQKSVIGSLDDTIQDMESKTIETTDYSNVVSTKNVNLTQSKFVNFDRDYNEKKLQKDIDNCVAQLSNAKTKVFIIDKEEIDSSTPMDLKKTMIYHLQDENGKQMKLKFDLPIIFEDHYMHIHGNKKVIQHIFNLKPLVKTGKNSVQIVSNYQKMFFSLSKSIDVKTNSLLRFILANKKELNVVSGNGVAVNTKYKGTREYNTIAKKIVQFQINQYMFILDTNALEELLTKNKISFKNINKSKELIIGYDLKEKKLLKMNIDDSFVDTVFKYMPEEYVEAVKKIGRKSNGGKLLMYTKTKPLATDIPLALLLFYFEGFSTVMKKAKIEYEIIPKDDKKQKRFDFDVFDWGYTELADGYIKWKRYPYENSLFMNGLNSLPMDNYTMEDLESKDTYMYLLTNLYDYANQTFNLDQYYDFMIDPLTKEILTDLHLPTDLVSLCILANKMLVSEDFAENAEAELRNMRIRSNDILAYHTYKAITEAYNQYRKTQHRKNPKPISVKQDAVIRKLLKQPASAMADASSLNPVLEISKLHNITYKGEAGTNEEHAFKLNIRAYNESMLGVLGITTANDSGVGINRQLTLEPNITSTRGYIDIAGQENVEKLNSAQLLTPNEMLTPLGVQHDDPARTAMMYKQSMYMVPVEDSDSVLIGNGIEKVLPYHLSSEFVIYAKDDGKVVEKTDDYIVVKYKDGTYRTIDTTIQMKKNAAAGFYIPIQMKTNLKLGDKVVKNEILAWDDRTFKKDGNEKEVSMRLGPLVKIAIIPEWDVYEDSAPISKNCSERLATQMVMPVTVSLNKDAYVSKMVKIGDHVNAGDTLITFDDFHDDPDVAALIKAMREDQAEDIVESSSTTKKTHYTGEIADIQVITTVELDSLSDSLKKIVSSYWKKIEKKDRLLEKYKNEGDMNFYKSGNLITQSATPVEPDYRGNVKGTHVEEGVIITFYVSFRDVMARGDKLSSEFALKSINSHVIEEGLEAVSEDCQDEPIDLIIAPLSVTARKTPSIFLAMFGNKLCIYAKRRLAEYWFNN